MCQDIIDRKINHLKWCECSTNASSKSQNFWFCAWNILAEDKDIITCWNEKCNFLRTYFWTHLRNASIHFWMKEFSIPSSASENLWKMEILCVKGDAIIQWLVTGKFRVLLLLVMFVEPILNARWIKQNFQAFLDSTEWLSNLRVNL